MKVFTCATFRGHHPVGTAAVVVADNAEDASMLLMGWLATIGLQQIIKPDQMTEMDATKLGVRILCDGDY